MFNSVTVDESDTGLTPPTRGAVPLRAGSRQRRSGASTVGSAFGNVSG
jgi:hypothetical protein